MTEPTKRLLRALTVWQPWAGLLAMGTKPVENRTWAPRPGELRPGEHVAIHAGVKYDEDCWRFIFALKQELEPLGRWKAQPLGSREPPWVMYGTKPKPDTAPDKRTPYGAIIGIAVLDEVRTSPRTFRDDAGEYEDPFWGGPVGWYLRDPVAFAPVFVKGAQGLWIVRDAALDQARENYRAAKAVIS